MLNDRELASLILLGVFTTIFMAVPRMRRSLTPAVAGVIRAFVAWRVLVVFVGFLVWVSGWIALAAWIGLWAFDLLKDSIIIVLTLGLPLLFRTMTAKSGNEIFKQIRVEALSISAVLLFYLNLEPLPLWAELLLQPLVVFVQLLNLVAGMKSEHRVVQRLTSGILILVGFAMLLWSTVHLVADVGSHDLLLLAKTLGLSVWLPLLMFPYFYGTAFYASSESILQRMQWIGGEAQLRRVRFAVFLGLLFSVKLASRFKGRYDNVARSATFREACRGMDDFRADVRRRDNDERERLARLNRFAGVPGVDQDGAQLDRGGLQVTKERLRWIGTTQRGRHEGNGNRFWNDLTDIMVDARRHGLPENHGFVTETTKDRKKWRAWRRLPSGWVLGIGGTARGDEFLYQGREPPSSWPPDSRQWTDASTEEWPSDWMRSDESHL